MINEKVKVLIIEDDTISSIFIESILEYENYEVVGIATDISQVELLIDNLQPDVLICDVNINGEIIFSIFNDNKYIDLPKLFITNNLDYITFNTAQLIDKSTFLAKPIHKYTFLAVLDLLLKQYPISKDVEKFTLVRGKHLQIIKLMYDDIAWIQAEGNYSIINTINNKKFVRRKSMSQILSSLDDRFVQVQKAFVINKNHISKIDSNKKSIFILHNQIPIGRGYRNALEQCFEQIE